VMISSFFVRGIEWSQVLLPETFGCSLRKVKVYTIAGILIIRKIAEGYGQVRFLVRMKGMVSRTLSRPPQIQALFAVP